MAFDDSGHHPLRSIVTAWIGKINKGIKVKQPWTDVSEECENFFSASASWLWDAKNKQKWWGTTEGGEVHPRFKLTVCRAFELVALFGPTLYWRNPNRTAEVRSFPEIDPAAFGIDPNFLQQPPDQSNPQAMQQWMQMQQAAQQFQAIQAEFGQGEPARKLRAELMQRYLNWTPNALSLHAHAELAITQALVNGRGLLWTLPYQPPGSQKLIVGSFFDPVENLVLDPDAEEVENAWWYAKKCTEPVWKIERDRKMRPGSMAKYATLESGNQQGVGAADPLINHHRATGQTQDLMVYWKVWSRCGLARLSELKSDLKEQIESVTGDYVFLEVCDGCPFPLNCPEEFLENATNEEVAKAFQWPIPFWKRDRLPFQYLDFYRRPKKPWPIAPLAPGLGELKAIQVLYSHMVNKIWMTQRDFIAYAKSASEEVKKIIEEGRDLSFLPLDAIDGNIKDLIQFLQHPPFNPDSYKMLDSLLQMFDRRVGLTDLLYGIQETASRSATDVKIREQMTNIRPEYMASKVEEWMSQVAKAEAMATRWYIQGQDVIDLFGRGGAMLWDQFISSTPVEQTIDEIDYRIEAASAQRPNRARDQGNLGDFIQTFGPLLDNHANATGDVTPLNNLIGRWGKIAQMDVRDLAMGNRPQPPDPSQQQQMQQQAEMQQQQAELAVEQQKNQAQLELEQQKIQAELAMKAQEHQQDLLFQQQEQQVDVHRMLVESSLEEQAQRRKLAIEQQAAKLKLEQDRKMGQQDLRQSQQQGKVQIQIAKKQAAARPNPQSAGTSR